MSPGLVLKVCKPEVPSRYAVSQAGWTYKCVCPPLVSLVKAHPSVPCTQGGPFPHSGEGLSASLAAERF